MTNKDIVKRANDLMHYIGDAMKDFADIWRMFYKKQLMMLK